MIWFESPQVIRCKSKKNSPGLLGHMPSVIVHLFFPHSLRDRYRMLKTLSPVPHSLQQDLAGSFQVQ